MTETMISISIVIVTLAACLGLLWLPLAVDRWLGRDGTDFPHQSADPHGTGQGMPWAEPQLAVDMATGELIDLEDERMMTKTIECCVHCYGRGEWKAMIPVEGIYSDLYMLPSAAVRYCAEQYLGKYGLRANGWRFDHAVMRAKSEDGEKVNFSIVFVQEVGRG